MDDLRLPFYKPAVDSDGNINCFLCGIPEENHGTSCGWSSASFSLDENNIIITKQHPGFGMVYNTWRLIGNSVTGNQ